MSVSPRGAVSAPSNRSFRSDGDVAARSGGSFRGSREVVDGGNSQRQLSSRLQQGDGNRGLSEWTRAQRSESADWRAGKSREWQGDKFSDGRGGKSGQWSGSKSGDWRGEKDWDGRHGNKGDWHGDHDWPAHKKWDGRDHWHGNNHWHGGYWWRPYWWGSGIYLGTPFWYPFWGGYSVGGYGYGYAYDDAYAYDAPVRTDAEFAPQDDPLAEQPEAPASDFLSQASEAFARGDYRNAVRLAQHAVVDNAQDLKARELLSLALFALGEFRGAAIEAHYALSLGPAADWPTLFRYYNDLGRYSKQIDALAAYAREHRDSAEAQFLLAYHNLMMGHKETAAKGFAKAATLAPKDQLSQKIANQLGGTPPPEANPPLPPPPTPDGVPTPMPKKSAANPSDTPPPEPKASAAP